MTLRSLVFIKYVILNELIDTHVILVLTCTVSANIFNLYSELNEIYLFFQITGHIFITKPVRANVNIRIYLVSTGILKLLSLITLITRHLCSKKKKIRPITALCGIP